VRGVIEDRVSTQKSLELLNSVQRVARYEQN